MVNAVEPAPEEAIKASIQKVAQAINTQDLDLYASVVTDDLLNMTLYGPGQEVRSTTSRQARLDELRVLFEDRQINRQAEMTPLAIHVGGDRAYVHVDGTLTFTPKQDDIGPGSRLGVDIYMFYRNDPVQGWQTERSMTIVRESTML